MEKEFEKVVAYQFTSLSSGKDNAKEFELKLLEDKDKIKKIEEVSFQERAAKESGLEIFPFIRDQLERKKILEQMKEEKFQKELTSRLKVIESDSIKKGYEEGQKIAKDEINKQMGEEVRKKLDSINELVKNCLSLREEIYNQQKDQILFLIKSLTKWVILRELKDDGKYLERLLEKLFSEIQTQQNFVIQVSKNDFEKMPEILKILEEKIGEFKNSRVVMHFDLPENGVIIDSENGMIKTTLDAQLSVLDEVFGNILSEKKESNDGTGKA